MTLCNRQLNIIDILHKRHVRYFFNYMHTSLCLIFLFSLPGPLNKIVIFHKLYTQSSGLLTLLILLVYMKKNVVRHFCEIWCYSKIFGERKISGKSSLIYVEFESIIYLTKIMIMILFLWPMFRVRMDFRRIDDCLVWISDAQ